MEKIKYPAAPQYFNLSKYPALKQNWNYSYNKLNEINNMLNGAINRDDTSIVVAGSYGRLDASLESDLDYMIFTEDHNDELDDIKSEVKTVCEKLDIKSPNPTGVFANIARVPSIVENTGGDDETISTLAQRMLLLMESKPIYNKKMYDDIVKKVIEKYLSLNIEDTTKECVFLLNDIIKYFRSICVNYQFRFWREEEKWVIRNIKLRHSRVVMYGGLLLLILNACKKTEENDNKFTYISSLIDLTPLEKIVHVYQDNNDMSFKRVLGIYNTFMRKLSDKDIREALHVDYEDRYDNPYYSELKVTSDALQTELTRFIFAQRGRWTEQVFEYLLF